jgi:hypothetical protein
MKFVIGPVHVFILKFLTLAKEFLPFRGGNQLISILLIHLIFQTAVSCGESQRISIPPMHVLCQTAVSCGGSQLIGWETRVARLGDFSPKNANLGTFGNRELFMGVLKIN